MPGGTDVGTGARVIFGTSAWTAELNDINWNGVERTPVEKTHHGSTLPASSGEVGGQEFVPNVIGDPGTLDLELNFDPSNPPPLFAPAETVTLEFKLKAGDATVAKIEGTGFITSRGASIPLKDGMMTATISVKCSGVWTETPAT